MLKKGAIELVDPEKGALYNIIYIVCCQCNSSRCSYDLSYFFSPEFQQQFFPAIHLFFHLRIYRV